MTTPVPRPSELLLVAVGGSAGSLARAGVSRLVGHDPGTWSWPTLLVNLVGSFALAALLVLMTAQSVAARRVRLLVGTGVLGGFTTFSAFVLDADELSRADRPATALGYLVVGLAAMFAGGAAGWWSTRRWRDRGVPS